MFNPDRERHSRSLQQIRRKSSQQLARAGKVLIDRLTGHANVTLALNDSSDNDRT